MGHRRNLHKSNAPFLLNQAFAIDNISRLRVRVRSYPQIDGGVTVLAFELLEKYFKRSRCRSSGMV